MEKTSGQRRRLLIRDWIFLSFLVVIVLVLVLPFIPERSQRRLDSPVYRTRISLKQLGFAFHSYHDYHAYKSFPPGGYAGGEGKGYHGWQTLLLPHFDEKPLYDRIDLSLPWNAPKNKTAFSTAVWAYHFGREKELEKWNKENGYAHTHLAANKNVFSENRFLQMRDVTDGLHNTIFAGEVAGDYLPWGHPRNWRDPADGINRGSHTFGAPDRDFCFLLMGDGSVHMFNKDIAPDVLKALSTPQGGEVEERD